MYHIRKFSWFPLLLAALVAVFCQIPVPCAAQQLSAAERASWSQKLTNLIPNSVEGIRTVQDLAALPPDDVYAILAENWPALSNSDIKQYILSCVVQNDNARVLDILQLGVADSSLLVQNKALQFSESFGFDSFTEDFTAYQLWRQQNAGKPLKDVILSSMKYVVSILPKTDEPHRSALLNILVRTNFSATSVTSRLRRDAALDSGLADALVPWIRQQNNFMWTAYQIIRNMRPSEEFIRRVVLPLSDVKTEPAVRYQALSVLGSEQNTWATEPLMKMMLSEYPDPSAEIIGQTLGQIGDPHIIPTFIAMMDADNTPEGNRLLGNILSPITGVTNAYVRDAAWWKVWWTRNNARFPADVRAMALPKLAVRQRPVLQAAQNGFQEAARPSLRQIAGDPKRAYWFIDPRINGNRLTQMTGRRSINPLVISAALRPGKAELAGQPPPPPIGKSAPIADAAAPGARANDAPGLIVVLTSDGDAASAAGFWYEAAAHALEKKYYIAVVAAPKWTPNQQSVWLTNPDMKGAKEAKFSTETLVADVVKDISATNTIDANRIFLHGIGAGGAAAYAIALDERSPFRGFYVLGATFKTSALPPLDRAAGKRFLIQNGKDDRVHPYWMAEAAQKLLTQKGATVKLDPTPGYLGSQSIDAVMGLIKASFDWMTASK